MRRIRPRACLLGMATGLLLAFSPNVLSAQERKPGDVCDELPPGGTRAACLEGAKLLLAPSPISETELVIWVRGNEGAITYRYELQGAGDASPDTLKECETQGALTLPLDAKTGLLLTADDIVYTWKMPALDLEVDLVPGRINLATVEARAKAPADPKVQLIDEETGAVLSTADARFIESARDESGRLRLQDFCGG